MTLVVVTLISIAIALVIQKYSKTWLKKWKPFAKFHLVVDFALPLLLIALIFAVLAIL